MKSTIKVVDKSHFWGAGNTLLPLFPYYKQNKGIREDMIPEHMLLREPPKNKGLIKRTNIFLRKCYIFYTPVSALALCISLFTLFFAASGCEKQINKMECCMCEMLAISYPSIARDCYVSSFTEGVSRYSQCSDAYVIMGITLEAYEYGRNIRLIEDLKGNFPKDITTFITWGNGGPGMTFERAVNMSQYFDNHDVLIMHIIPADTFKYEHPGLTWFEKQGDYCLLPWCVSSVLELSDGYVIGNILPHKDGIQTISWRNFQKELNKSLKNK